LVNEIKKTEEIKKEVGYITEKVDKIPLRTRPLKPDVLKLVDEINTLKIGEVLRIPTENTQKAFLLQNKIGRIRKSGYITIEIKTAKIQEGVYVECIYPDKKEEVKGVSK